MWYNPVSFLSIFWSLQKIIMECGVLESLIIFYSIKNQDTPHVKYTEYPVHVFLVHLCQNKLGTLGSHHLINHTTDKYKIAHTHRWQVFNNFNIITFSNKTTTSDDFEDIHQYLFYGISDYMASLAQNGKYDSINTNNPKTMVYSVLNYVSDDYVLHEYTTCAGEIETTGKPFFNTEYITCMK